MTKKKNKGTQNATAVANGQAQVQNSANSATNATNSTNTSTSSNVSTSPSKRVTFPNVADKSSSYYLPPSGRGLKPSPSENTLRRLDRQTLVLWRHPLKTVYYCLLELKQQTIEFTYRLFASWRLVLLLVFMLFAAHILQNKPGIHQQVFEYIHVKVMWSAWWVGLGVLSSVGLGSGLHTFLLYLGPHIAQVTLAAYECESLKFPEPPYPDEIMCPENSTVPLSNNNVHTGNLVELGAVSLWAIMSKVRLEAFMWGAGTALGELPPYFMARTARLSDEEPDDEEYKEFKQFLEQQNAYEGNVAQHQSPWDKVKIYMEKFIARVGFFGILLCASIPNPLFDLAGITCGHFLVPFWTFFGATLIGKALIKMHIQKLFVIFMFSEHHVENLLGYLRNIPAVGAKIEAPLQEFLRSQKLKLRRKPGEHIAVKQSMLGSVLEYVVITMVVYFVISIINGMAQSYDKRLWKLEKDEKIKFKSKSS